MKLLYLSLCASAFMLSGFAHASDTSATLYISGATTNAETRCTVNIDRKTISLESMTENIIIQGSKAIPHKVFSITLSGNEECNLLQLSNHIAYRFLGTTDSVDGTVLANTDMTSEAAKGVGIGLFSSNGEMLNLHDAIPATDTVHIGLEMVALKRTVVTAGSVTSTLTVQVERL